MSRHRNIRQMNYDEDYAGYNDVYGRSLDEDYPVSASPSDSQYMFDRSKSTQLAQFMNHEEDISEEEPEEVDGLNTVQANLEKTRKRLDSLTIESAISKLGPDEAIRMKHCQDVVHDVVGDSVPDNIIAAHIIQAKFDAQLALHNILDGAAIDPSLIMAPEPVKKIKIEKTSSREVPKVASRGPQNASEICQPPIVSDELPALPSSVSKSKPLPSVKVEVPVEMKIKNPLFTSPPFTNKCTPMPKKDVGLPVTNPLFQSQKENGLSLSTLLSKSPLSPSNSLQSGSIANKNPLFGNNLILLKNTLPSDTPKPVEIMGKPQNPLFAPSTRPINPLFSVSPLGMNFTAKPILPIVRSSTISSAVATSPHNSAQERLNIAREIMNSGPVSPARSVQVEIMHKTHTNNHELLSLKPSIFGRRLFETFSPKKWRQAEEPHFCKVWSRFQEKLPNKVFKFDTPSPDKLVGVGLGGVVGIGRVSSESEVSEVKNVELPVLIEGLEAKEFPPTAPKSKLSKSKKLKTKTSNKSKNRK